MLSAADLTTARELQRRLAEFAEIRDFRVYGSRARGDGTDESDMDVYVLVEDLTPEIRERIRDLAWDVGFERDTVISTVVARPEEIEHGPFGANPLLRRIEEEGIPVP